MSRRGWGAGALALGVALLVAAVVIGVRLATRSPAPRRTPTVSTTVTPVPAPAPARPAPAGLQLGASVNRLFNDGTQTPAQITAQLAALHATGATLARSDALWEASEPAAPIDGVHHDDWSFDDTIAADLASAGLQWLPILDYSAPWAQSIPGQDHSPPASDADYAAYAQAFAARYGTGGSFWTTHPELPADPVAAIEIWNEPDNAQFWVPRPDPAAYAALYLAARGAIDAVDPSARVIVGGLVHPAAFLPAMLHAAPALAGHIDGVAIHPYGDPAVVLSRVSGARAAMTSLGMGSVPLYVTEFGWTVSPPGAPDYAPAARRPGDIQSTLTALGHSDCGLAAVLLYTWVTPERDPGDSGDWYGIHAVGVPGDTVAGDAAASAAFAAGLRAARAPAPTRAICHG